MSRYAVFINRRSQKNLAAAPIDAYGRIKKALVALGGTHGRMVRRSSKGAMASGSASATTAPSTRSTTRTGP